MTTPSTVIFAPASRNAGPALADERARVGDEPLHDPRTRDQTCRIDGERAEFARHRSAQSSRIDPCRKLTSPTSA